MNTYKHIKSEANLGQDGQSMVLFSFMLATLLMVVALVTDIGMLTVQRREIQNAADAAVLAGARVLPEQPDLAVADAKAYAYKNGVGEDEVKAVSVLSTGETNDSIEIEITRSVSFGFAKLLGISDGTVSVRAVAQTGTVIGGNAMAPFGVEESVFAGLNQGDTTTLKYNATTQTDGNFLPLSLDGTGSAQYEENIQYGSEQWLCAAGYETANCSSTVTTEPGNMVGSTKRALEWVIENTSTSCDSYEEVFIVDSEDSRHEINPVCNRFSNPTSESYRLMLVPIISNLCNGRCDITVQEFSLFFLESFTCGGGGLGNTCDVIGRYAQAEGNISSLIGSFDPDGPVRSVLLIE
jgi:Flp pilus assembly protein TadG